MHIVQTNAFLIVTNFNALERAWRPTLRPALRHVLGLELDRVFTDFERYDAPTVWFELERDLDASCVSAHAGANAQATTLDNAIVLLINAVNLQLEIN